MEEHTLQCPNCGASLDIEDGLDTCYCKYCGYKIILTGQSDQAYRSKTRILGMRHDERMLDKELEHERFKIRAKREDKKLDNKIFAISICASILLIVAIFGSIKWSSDKEEQKLQAIVDEVMADIKNEDFDDAYIKAQSIVYTSDYSDEIEEKWENTRREVINQIVDAEKKETGSSKHKKEKKGFLKSIFG